MTDNQHKQSRGRLGLLNRSIDESASEWLLPAPAARFLFWLPLVGAVAFVAIRFNKDLYRFLLREDGPVEWMQFVCFLLAGLFAVLVAKLEWNARHKWLGALFAIFAFGMLFIAGEEISWGQRVFGIETPEALDEINKQGETTLHNIFGVLMIFNLIMMTGAAWSSVAWYLNRFLRLERLFPQAPYVFVPPFFLMPAFLVLFVYRLLRFTAFPKGGMTITKYGEWAELCLAMALGIYAWLNYRRVASAQPSASTGKEAVKFHDGHSPAVTTNSD